MGLRRLPLPRPTQSQSTRGIRRLVAILIIFIANRSAHSSASLPPSIYEVDTLPEHLSLSQSLSDVLFLSLAPKTEGCRLNPNFHTHTERQTGSDLLQDTAACRAASRLWRRERELPQQHGLIWCFSPMNEIFAEATDSMERLPSSCCPYRLVGGAGGAPTPAEDAG